MTPFDLIITVIPALATLGFTAGILRAAVSMAPPTWSYWLPVVFAACCIALPFRYGPGFIPDDPTHFGSPRAFILDLLLQGSFTAVAIGLSLRAIRCRICPPARLAWLLLILSSLLCLFLAVFQAHQILQDQS